MTSEKKIVVSKDGPYLVSGGVPLSMQIITPNEDGLSWEWKEAKTFRTGRSYSLCRCGHSKNKPFCDDTHMKIGFDGTETATRQPFARQSEVFDGPALTLNDAEEPLRLRPLLRPRREDLEPDGESDDPEARKLAIREAAHCPAGRLVVHDKKTKEEIEPKLPQSIGVIEDPALGCSGPLWVRGGITVESENGIPYERRNRVALCRCGASSNMPFCNGSHASIRFRDGLVEFVKLKPGE